LAEPQRAHQAKRDAYCQSHRKCTSRERLVPAETLRRSEPRDSVMDHWSCAIHPSHLINGRARHLARAVRGWRSASPLGRKWGSEVDNLIGLRRRTVEP
jgi:hypothetical protein